LKLNIGPYFIFTLDSWFGTVAAMATTVAFSIGGAIVAPLFARTTLDDLRLERLEGG